MTLTSSSDLNLMPFSTLLKGLTTWKWHWQVLLYGRWALSFNTGYPSWAWHDVFSWWYEGPVGFHIGAELWWWCQGPWKQASLVWVEPARGTHSLTMSRVSFLPWCNHFVAQFVVVWLCFMHTATWSPVTEPCFEAVPLTNFIWATLICHHKKSFTMWFLQLLINLWAVSS